MSMAVRPLKFEGSMIFANDLSAPEGPVALPDGTWLIVEGGAARGCVTWLSADGKTRKVIRETGRPNGLAVDAEGAIWVAESKTPSLLRVTMAGEAEVVATGCDGEPFLFPNDLCFGPDGGLYLTDSGVNIDHFAPDNKIREDYRDVHYDGRVYRVDVTRGAVEKIDEGLIFTNGVAVGPDLLIYANETLTGNIYRYRRQSDGSFGARELFGNTVRPIPGPEWKGPDGMAFGADGNLYVAVFGQQEVAILGTNGDVVRRIPTMGKLPTNVAFALPGSRRIHVTEYEIGQMEVFEIGTDGLALWLGPKARIPAQV
jgi:gluconolactonase